MKAKIFAKLKQEYSPLGLGDEVLMSRASALAETGLVTDENIDAVVAVQRHDLEGLQKFADKRVSSALATERKKREEETLKKEEEAKAAEEAKKQAEAEASKKAAEDAAKKAEKDAADKAAADAANKAAAEDAKRKATEEAERKAAEDAKLAELAQKDEVISKLNERLSTLADQFSEFVATGKRKDDAYNDSLKKLKESKAQLEEQLKNLVDESTAVKEAQAKAERKAKIEAKAKELGVPEWRINEGFTIEDDASDETISGVLAMVANNINTHLLPGSKGFNPLTGSKPTDEEVSKLAASLVK